MRVYLYLFGLIFLASNCEPADVLKVDFDVKGIWTIEKVFSNDYWGGRSYWKNSNYLKQIKFTSDQQFYAKAGNDFELIGSYKVLSENMLEITWDNPKYPQYPTFIKTYEITSAGQLILSTGYTSGVISEKFKRLN